MARILIIEDNPHNLQLVTYLLEASGHTVLAAATGARGVAMAQAHRPDLSLLDIQLPDMDGYQVLALLRSQGTLSDLPVLALTAYAMLGDRDRMLGAGFDGYVSKPIDPLTFNRTISAYLPMALRGHEPSARWSSVQPTGAAQAVADVSGGGQPGAAVPVRQLVLDPPPAIPAPKSAHPIDGPTVTDVARAARVSPTTAARALRGQDDVAPRTRARVAEAARELRFSLRGSASRDPDGPTGTIGIVTPYLARWYFMEVFAGVDEGSRSFDVNMMLHPTGAARVPGGSVGRASERMRGRVDGILVVSLDHNDPVLEGLFDLDLPVVMLGTEAQGLPSVSIDDRLAADTAVQHLVDQGHERIALISGQPLPSRFVPENARLAGYLDVLTRHGLDTHHSLRQAGLSTMRGGEQAMDRLLAERSRPTAVFCMSDEMAYGALRALTRNGLVAGVDVAVIGFDGHELAEAFDLSTIVQSVRTMGYLAARVLMGHISSPTNPYATVVPTVLHARASTGC